MPYSVPRAQSRMSGMWNSGLAFRPLWTNCARFKTLIIICFCLILPFTIFFLTEQENHRAWRHRLATFVDSEVGNNNHVPHNTNNNNNNENKNQNHKDAPNHQQTANNAGNSTTRIAKVSMLFNNNDETPIYERALANHEAHNAIHNYGLHILRGTLTDDVWSKPAYILSLLMRELEKPEAERLQWLMWVDADTIIMNPLLRIETYLPPATNERNLDQVHLLYTRDWNGVNNGVFLTRVNAWSAEFFAAIMSYRTYRPNADLLFRDQSAFTALVAERGFKEHAVAVPQQWFNAYRPGSDPKNDPWGIRKGDLLVHFAGVEHRKDVMKRWLDRADKHLGEWEREVGDTGLVKEVEKFWKDVHVD